MSEATLRTAIAAACRARGARPIKYHGTQYSESGIPDLLVCYRGRFVFFEVKVPGKHMTPIQRRRAEELWAAGAYGGEAHSVAEAAFYLDCADRDIDST
jgi:hypothetical protein